MIWILRKTFLFLSLYSFFPWAVRLCLNSGIDIFSFSAYSILSVLCILFIIIVPCSSPIFFLNLYYFGNLKYTFGFCIIHEMMRVLVNHIAQSYFIVYLLLEIRSFIISKSWLNYKIFTIFCFCCFNLFLYSNKILLVIYCSTLFIIFLNCSIWSTFWSFWLCYRDTILWISRKNPLFRGIYSLVGGLYSLFGWLYSLFRRLNSLFRWLNSLSWRLNSAFWRNNFTKFLRCDFHWVLIFSLNLNRLLYFWFMIVWDCLISWFVHRCWSHFIVDRRRWPHFFLWWLTIKIKRLFWNCYFFLLIIW